MFGDRELDLSDSHSGTTRHNAYRSYRAAGYRARGAAARACASRLLAKANIRTRIAELQEEEEGVWALYVRPWRTLLPQAQKVLEDAMAGKDITSVQVQAARAVIELAEGPLHLRFQHKGSSGESRGVSITLWSGESRGAEDRAIQH